MSNLLKFAIPLLIGNIAQQLYSTVDSIIVGRYMANGDAALAAIGASMPVINLLLVLFMAISTGAGIMVAQYRGARQGEQLAVTIGTSCTLIFLSCLVVMAIGGFFSRPIMTLLDTPEAILDMSVEYLVIVFVGILGSAFYNILSGVLRGLGDSTMPLIFLLIATALNIVLDIVFVKNCGWGVAGVAYATIIAQTISAVLCVWRLMTLRDIVEIRPRHLRPDWKCAATLAKLGLPAGVTQAIFSFSMVAVQLLVNRLGEAVITTSVLVMRVDGFAMLPNFTFGMAVSTFVGQNIGARKMDRVTQGTHAALIAGLVSSCLLTGAILLFGGAMLRLFTQTQAIIDLGVRQMRILAAGYIAMSVMQVYAGVLRGAGDTMPSMIISMFTTVLVRVPLAYGLAAITKSEAWPEGSPDALFISLLSSWVVGALLTYLWYRLGKWKKKTLFGEEAAA